jgi:hypothetical protein
MVDELIIDWLRSEECANLEIPILVNGLDSPVELLSQCFGEETLDWDVKLL